MITGSFDYHLPSTLDEAISLLASHGDEGRVIAGGQSLIPMMKLRMAVPTQLIDLSQIESLRGISIEGDRIVIGAMTTQSELLASTALAECCPILAETARVVADPQVRNKGTIGGNAANGDPGNDMPAVMICLDAQYRLVGPHGQRDVAAREFYEGAYFTQRAEDEILSAIHIPAPPSAGYGSAYEKLKRKTGDYATAAAAVALTVQGGNCTAASIALTNVADRALLAEAAGQALVGSTLDDAAIAAAVAAAKTITEPIEDMRGSADYKTAMAGVMTERALRRAIATARG